MMIKKYFITTIIFLVLSGLSLSAAYGGQTCSYKEGEEVTVKKCGTDGECRVVFEDEGGEAYIPDDNPSDGGWSTCLRGGEFVLVDDPQPNEYCPNVF